jgi:hypothetical protein
MWSFSYTPGIASYRIRRTATIENLTDSTAPHETVTNLAHELLTLERIGDTIVLTLAADTFVTSTQGVISTAASVTLPVHLEGVLTPDSLHLAVDTLTTRCDPVQSAVRSDLHNLITRFPPQLSTGMMWTDSVEVEGCQGMIPTTADISRSYRVTGETVFKGQPVIVIERRDSIRAHGDGAQQQHRIVIDAGGNGTTIQYLSLSGGQIVSITASQDLDITIRASGQLHRFRQSLKQEIAIER